MALRNHAIGWGPAPPLCAQPDFALAAPWPAPLLQQLLERHGAFAPHVASGRWSRRRSLALVAASGSALWLVLIASADLAVRLVA